MRPAALSVTSLSAASSRWPSAESRMRWSSSWKSKRLSSFEVLAAQSVYPPPAQQLRLAPRRDPAAALRLTPAGTDAGASAVRTFFWVLRHAGEVPTGAALLRVAARRHRVRAVRRHALGGVVRLRRGPREGVVIVRRHAGVEQPEAAASLRLPNGRRRGAVLTCPSRASACRAT